MAGKLKILNVEDEISLAMPMTFLQARPDCAMEVANRGSNPSHQTTHSYIQSVCKCLNRKEAWIFQTTLHAAKKGSINIRFGRKSFLRQLSLESDLSDTSAELLCNVVAHSRHSYPERTGSGCRLYPTAGLTSNKMRYKIRQVWIFGRLSKNMGTLNMLFRRGFKSESMISRAYRFFFGNLFPRSIYYFSEIDAQSSSYFQNGFQSGISVAIFDVGDHLWREPGFLSHKVFGHFSPLASLPQKRNNFDAKCLSVSIHPAELLENGVDSAFHYGEIAPRD